jgi:glycerol uptake facilitator protein/aquaporin Z/aquaporin NIP
MATVTLPRTEPVRTAGHGLYGSRIDESAVAAAAAELIGTAILVFAITATASAATLALPIAGGGLGSLAVVLANGLALAALAAALGHVSGAHLNPAVTIGLAVTGRFPWTRVLPYAVAQVAGGVLGALATWAVYGAPARDVAHLGATHVGNGVSDGRAFVAEALVTFVLAFVVIAVASDPRVHAAAKSIAAGFALAAAVFIAGPITGAGVNPARALGPMLIADALHGWWVFVVAPIVGAVVACVAYDQLLRRTRP